LGYMPPVNSMPLVGSVPVEQPSFPAQLLHCPRCHLVQLGTVVNKEVLFPPEYPYTSSTTKVLRENFQELSEECRALINPDTNDLILDIGSNDGNLLAKFKGFMRVLGVTPEAIGQQAIDQGIPTILDYFTHEIAARIQQETGTAKIITATNAFAHIDNIHQVLNDILSLLREDGVFISESHYLLPLLQDVQYDTVYHEHLRYYSLHSLKFLLEMHGLEVFHAKEIPSHGGSIRVYAARPGRYIIQTSVKEQLKKEKDVVTSEDAFTAFRNKARQSKLSLQSLLCQIKEKNQRIFGISAPSRGTILANYTGLQSDIIECTVEVAGSHKIGKYLPGTLIPIVSEEKLFTDQPEFALLFSWHIAAELMPKLRKKGYRGNFIIPLPNPRIIYGSDLDLRG